VLAVVQADAHDLGRQRERRADTQAGTVSRVVDNGQRAGCHGVGDAGDPAPGKESTINVAGQTADVVQRSVVGADHGLFLAGPAEAHQVHVGSFPPRLSRHPMYIPLRAPPSRAVTASKEDKSDESAEMPGAPGLVGQRPNTLHHWPRAGPR
jgi:hypothetical protein